MSSGLSAIFGVRDIVPRIWGYYFDEVKGANYTVLGLDSQPDAPGRKAGPRPWPRAVCRHPGTRGGVLVGRSVRQACREKGSTLLSLFRPDLSQASFEIAGVFKSATDILTNDLIVMHIDDARDLFQISSGHGHRPAVCMSPIRMRWPP